MVGLVRRIVRIAELGLLAALGLSHAGVAFADSYPDRTVQIVVPYPPGGGVDLSGRILAQQLSTQLGQNFIIVNKAGASGIIGTQAVSESKPDGYTLVYAPSTLAIAPYLMATKTLDVERDLTPITEVAYTSQIMVVNPSVPAKDPKELVAYIKAHPNDFRWGGTPASPDLFGIAQFDKAAGIDPLLVPYNGTGPGLTALLGGEISGMMILPGLALSNIQSGKLRALGVTSENMIDMLPGVPTVASFGYPGFESVVWYGLWGPKDMSKDLATEIQQDVSRALTNPQVKQQFLTNGLFMRETKTPDEFGAYVSSEVKKNTAIIEENNMRATQ